MSNTDFKLSVDDQGPQFKIVNQDRVVAITCGTSWSTPSLEAERDVARRIVACWNACEGTSTEWLEGRASGMKNGSPRLDDQFDKTNGLLSALIDAEARLSLLFERDEHKLLDVVARDKAERAIEAFYK